MFKRDVYAKMDFSKIVKRRVKVVITFIFRM
jgi:hypothetical protein